MQHSYSTDHRNVFMTDDSTSRRAAPATTEVADLHTTTELVALARARLAAPAWEFIAGGAETETTILRNRQALDSVAFRPRVLRNVEHATPRTSFLGLEQRLPVHGLLGVFSFTWHALNFGHYCCTVWTGTLYG